MGLWVKARHMWGSHLGELSRRMYHEEEGVPRGEDDEEGAHAADPRRHVVLRRAGVRVHACTGVIVGITIIISGVIGVACMMTI